jgi:2,3-bisphosphoglycerate-dependent phosphoglycerate mutase
MTEILLIRHGETLWNQQGRMQGQHDSPLTPLGMQQAKQLGRRLSKVSFSALYASDLGRAHQTARCIADATGHEIVADPGLRERHFGIFEGLTHTEIKTKHPDLHELFARRLPDFVMPGGESAAQFMDRCVGALERIAARHEGETIAVVTHGLVLDSVYRRAVGMPIETPRGFPLLNCSLNTFRYDGNGWLAVAVCDVSHLSDDDVTRFSDANV